jgi:uncharacterized RDD family membrane protein YckC
MNEPNLASAEFGGFWLRFLAFVVDSAIVFLIMALIIAGGAAALGSEAVGLAALLAWLFGFLYWPLLQASRLQSTLGKALLGMRVTGYQGNRLSFLRALGRELAKILSGAVFMLGYVVAAFTARKQSLHDLVASTLVVRESRARIVPALALAVAAFVLPVVAVPLLVGAAMVDSMMATMTAMSGMQEVKPPPAMKPAPRPAVVAAAPKPQPVPELPKPAPVAEKAAPVAEKAAVLETKVAPAIVAVVATAPPAPVIEPKQVEVSIPEPKKASPRKTVAKKAAPPQPRAVPAAKAPAVFEPKTTGPKFNDLVTAVLYRDAEAIAELLKFGRWADKPDSRGTTPLMLAVELGDPGSAEVLLRGGADPMRAVPVAHARRDGAMLDLLKRYERR